MKGNGNNSGIMVVVGVVAVLILAAIILSWLSPVKYEKRFATQPNVAKISALYKQCKERGGEDFYVEKISSKNFKGWKVTCK